MKLLLYIFIGVIVSCYYFSFGLTVLPEEVNTKMILALIGLLLSVFNILKNRMLNVSWHMLIAVIIAVLFSIIGYISVDINNTFDYSYANYFISFFVWIFAAYTVIVLIESVHGKFDLKILCYYLASVCVAQCFLALYIDVSHSFRALVDLHVIQGQQFLKEVDRLYGIGASLDNAGVRFSVVLILIAAVVSKEKEVYKRNIPTLLLLLSFFLIVGIGNMISRTTLLGSLIALFILFWNLRGVGVLNYVKYKKIYVWFSLGLMLIVIAAVYFYQTDSVYRTHIRFAFEGFFNWIEKGKWYTDSTNKLNKNMWVWPDPQDTKGWLIGTGLFDNWVYGTDIGYCRFILYNGLLGIIVFIALFVYLPLSFIRQLPNSTSLFLGLFIFTFLVWIKVSTDIFFIYALLFGLVYTDGSLKTLENENRI